ncbi:MAG: PQQ-binding-like beta-propeller repeat protein, partial [Acidobacteria bacterium]|nr:PQQ-binding-like beta-propeller repeat protein [Acidobacteriota bacterium]
MSIVRAAAALAIVTALHAFASPHLPISQSPHLHASQSPQLNWPQFRNTPTLSGVTTATLPATLRLQWTFEARANIDSSAAIVNNVVYVGSGDGKLLAIDAATGKQRWAYQAVSDNYGIGESSPAVANGIVYIGDLSGVFHAVDAATGKARWTFKTGAEIKSSPVVSAGKVLIGSYDGYLYALDAATGTQAWKVQTDNYVHATPAIWNGVAYFGG